MSEVDHTTIRVRELIEATEPFCPGNNKFLSVNLRTGKLRAEFFLEKTWALGELESVLVDFGDILGSYLVFEKFTFDAIREMQSGFRFSEIEELAIEDIRSLPDRLPNPWHFDRIYNLRARLDPAQGQSLYYAVGSGREFQHEVSRLESEYGNDYFETADELAYFRYFAFETHSISPRKELRELLAEECERTSDLLRRFGNSYSNHCHFAEHALVTDIFARALNKNHEVLRNWLPTTDDFVSYVDYFDEHEIVRYRALRLTIDPGAFPQDLANLFASY